MKLIVLSDTHIKPGRSLLSLLPQDLISLIKNSDLVIHAGDFETMECYNELQSLTKLIAVHGDTDCDELMGLLPEHKVIDVEGVKIGIIHKGQLTSELEIIDKRVKGKIIRCTGDVCNYFTYEKT